MDEPVNVWAESIWQHSPYQVNTTVMEITCNLREIFLLCLPSFNNREIKIREDINKKFGLESMEVTEDVFESPASIVFDEAENRIHTI